MLDISIGFLSSMNSFMSLVMTLKYIGFLPTLNKLRGLLFSMTSFIPSTSSRTLKMVFNIMVFPNVADSSEIPVGLQHHISVEILLRRIQQSPLFLSEVHMHIIIGHNTLSQII